jgi:hypothetical protein
MGIFNYGNPKFSGSPSVPVSTGDRYWDQDLQRDHRYYQEQLGLIYNRVFGKEKAILSGLTTTQGAGHTINITSGYGIAKFSVEILHRVSAWTIPPSTENDDIFILIRVPSNITNQAITSAVTDGVTVNYVKLAYLETDGNTRARAKKAGSYSYEIEPDYLLTVDDTSPTDYEIVLQTFTSDGATLTFLGNSSTIINKELNQFNSIDIEGVSTEIKYLQIGINRTGNGYSYIDLIGDTTYTDYGLRIVRGNTGANANTEFLCRGTGSMNFKMSDAGDIKFYTNSAFRSIINDTGHGIGTISPDSKLHVESGVLNITKLNAGMPESGTNYTWNSSGIFFDLAYNASMYGLFGIGTNGGFSGDIMYNYFRKENLIKILATDLGGYSGIRFNSDGNIEFRASLDGTPSQHKAVGDPVTRLLIDAATGNVSVPDSTLGKFCVGTGLDGQFYSNSDNVYIENITQDKDMIFRVNDGGVNVNAIYIDASASTLFAYDTLLSSDRIEINNDGSGNREAFIDFHGDDTYPDYGLRIKRHNTGPNAISEIVHRGTGSLLLKTFDAAGLAFYTSDTLRGYFGSTGNFVLNDGNALYLGTGFDGKFSISSDDLYIQNQTQDKDIIFTLNQGGSPTDAFKIYGADITAEFIGVLTYGTEYRTDTPSETTAQVKTKIIEIGDWNMNFSAAGNQTVSVAHNLGTNVYKKIRNIQCTIRNDADTNYSPLNKFDAVTVVAGDIFFQENTYISLYINSGCTYDSANYDSTGYNRGWIYIVYEV